MPAARRYLRFFLGAVAAVYVTVGIFNFVVDPFGLYPGPEVKGVNDLKVDVSRQVRMIKAFQVMDRKPHGLVVGSSRALLGLPADDPAWPDRAKPVYNLSLYGGYLYETMRYFQHAVALGTVRDAVLAVDLWMFDRDWVTRSGFDESRFLVTPDGTPNEPDTLEPLRMAFAWDTFRASLRTISRQDRMDMLVQHDNGASTWRSDEAWLRTKHSHRRQFGYMERMFGTTAWRPERSRRWDITDPNDPTSPLRFFRTMVRLAHDENIALKVVISPSHARIWETLRAGGMWQTWEDWKRALLAILEDEAARAGTGTYPLWDFSGYNTVTTEAVPRDASPMQWYLDGSHFKQRVGAMMLDRIFGHDVATVPDDFGRRLTPARIDDLLAEIRARRSKYARSHPQEVEEASRWAEP